MATSWAEFPVAALAMTAKPASKHTNTYTNQVKRGAAVIYKQAFDESDRLQRQ